MSDDPPSGGRTGRLLSDGFALRYRLEGEGEDPPLLVVGSAIYHPRTFSQALRRRRRLAFIDHRGFAGIERPLAAQDAALERVVGDIERMRLHLGLARVDILGHSGNGYLALEYARRFPAHVGHVVAVATSPDFSPAHLAAQERRWQETVAPERKRIDAEQMAALARDLAAQPDQGFIALCIRMRARSWFDPRYDPAPLWRGVRVNMPVIDRLWGETFRDLDMHALLREVRAPILLALGRCDYLSAPASAWDAYRADARRLTVRHFERSAHSPQMEEPALFDQALLEHLQG
ncbi:alpha/beta fold hydrolase [Cupriavidus basilensis]|uniref:alpha/beta fold hydrolase n=1 Tax=Cupriavidus basilensis TaxID=68895 RepID=UPI000750A871|nr:alpha/beta hydrolase [Cupriavidus basilensis]